MGNWKRDEIAEYLNKKGFYQHVQPTIVREMNTPFRN